MKLKEKDVIYKVYNGKQNTRYHPKTIEEIDEKHNEMFCNILSRKKEMVNFLNDFLLLNKKIKQEEIILCDTDLITKQYQEKSSELIYKWKQKPVYFLVKHQSRMDPDMPFKIGEAVGRIMRKESIVEKTYLRKDKVYPVVVPIVIYTGFQEGKVKTNFVRNQYRLQNDKHYEIDLEYNLIARQDYTVEELLEKKTLFSKWLI